MTATTSSPTSGTATAPLGTATTNPNGPTQVAVNVRAPDGLLFFDPANNQLIEIPRSSVQTVMAEINGIEAWRTELIAARNELVEAEAALEVLVKQRFPSLTAKQAIQARIVAAERRFLAAQAKIKAELGDQGYLTGASNGRELMELIPLAKRERAGAPGQVWGKKFTYVRSDKMRDHWRGYKLGAGDKGQSISFIKDGRIDTNALREQFTKIEPKLKADWALAHGYIWPQLQSWADSMKIERRLVGANDAELRPGESQLSVDLKTEAHLFRYFAGAGLEGAWAPQEGKLGGKANAKAEIQLARAEAAIECIYPRAEGWAWSLPGVESGQTFHIGAMRFLANIKVGAGAGASVAAELALELDYSAAMANAKGPAVKGRRRKGQAEPEPRAVSLNDLGEAANAGVGAEAFAGVKASGEFMGGLQYLSPEQGDKFDFIAAVGPKVEGQAGAGAGANLFITYEEGKFRIRAKAGLCVGLGAKGELGLEVGARRIGSFLQFFFHALLNANFEFLNVMHRRAYEEAVRVQVLMVRGVVDAYQNLTSEWRGFMRDIEREEVRVALMDRVLSDPIALRTCTPEAHGILLYQLTRHDTITKAIPANTGMNFELMYRRKQAVLQVCRWAQTKRQFENIVQHISPTGAKGGFRGNLDGLLRFMEIGLADSQLDDDLLRIYARLPDQPASGYAVALNHTSEFFAQAKVGPSPTYLAMLGNGLPLPGNFA
jgi:hypothetical protein